MSPSASATTKGALDLALIFSFVRWENMVFRGQHHVEDQITQQALQSGRIGRLLLGDSFRSLASRLISPIRPAPHTLPSTPPPERATGERVARYSPIARRRGVPTTASEAEAWSNRYETGLRRAALAASLREPTVVVFNPILAGFGRFEWAGAVVHYAFDDFSAHPEMAAISHVVEESYRRCREQQRITVSVSAPLHERLAPTGPSIVLPNAVDAERWSVSPPPPAWLNGHPGPIAVYTGTVDDRLDPDAVASVARALDGGTLLIVGGEVDDRLDPRIRSIPGVVLHGAIPHDEVPSLLAGVDLAVLPHRSTPLTRSMSPLKVYEYLAAGLPVIATDLVPVRGISEHIFRVAPGGDFEHATRDALGSGRTATEARQRFIAENSWNGRFDRLLTFLEGTRS